MIRWIMRCSQCKADYAYTEEPSQEPKFGMTPVAQYWRYMNDEQIQPGAVFYCTKCGSGFQPMVQDVIIEETTKCVWTN